MSDKDVIRSESRDEDDKEVHEGRMNQKDKNARKDKNVQAILKRTLILLCYTI